MNCCSKSSPTKDNNDETDTPYQFPMLKYTATTEIPSIVQKARAVATAQTLYSAKQRKEVLNDLIDFFTTHEKKVFDALKADLNRHTHESYVVEYSQIMGELHVAHSNVEKWMKPSSVGTGMNTVHMLDGLSIKPEPLGLVCVIAPWNYPLSMCFAPIAGAIAAGNVVVLKPSELSENCSAFIAEELPKFKSLGNFIHVINGGKDETTELLKHKFDHIFYTGNGLVGRIVMKAAAEYLTPVTLELGGKSPVLVHESSKSHLDYAAKRILWGKFVNCGQTCVGPDYVLVHRSVEKDLIASLKKARDEFFGISGGNGGGKDLGVKTSVEKGTEPSDSAAFKAMHAADSYSRIINDRHWKRIVSLFADNETSHCEVAFGGERDEASKFITPTVLTNVNVEKAPVMKDEIFGPLLPVIPYDSVDEAINFVNRREKPLALYVFSQNKAFTDAVLGRTSSGGVTINDVMMHVGSTFIPFGGVGESGMGRYHGKFSFDTFSHHRSILHKGINGLSESINGNSRYPPYTASMTNLVKKLI